ncbi:MAG: lysophospholipase [Phycisphaera sp.]|nr:lysophospholipase [Phycisphaera sp.]
MPAFAKGNVILFQGDSITDGNRGRSADPNHILGHGYCFIISAKYGAMYPDRELDFMNRGVSGNTVANLQARWDADTLKYKPDVLSILIGVNDIGRGVSVEDYEKQYDKLLADTVAALPNVQLILGEPFGLPVGKVKGQWDTRREKLEQFRAVVEKLAAKYHAPVVHYQQVFDDACSRAPADYWIWDGVHPTYRGHQLMADAWVATLDAWWREKHGKK